MRKVILILLIILFNSCQKEEEERYSEKFIEENSIKVFDEIEFGMYPSQIEKIFKDSYDFAGHKLKGGYFMNDKDRLYAFCLKSEYNQTGQLPNNLTLISTDLIKAIGAKYGDPETISRSDGSQIYKWVIGEKEIELSLENDLKKGLFVQVLFVHRKMAVEKLLNEYEQKEKQLENESDRF